MTLLEKKVDLMARIILRSQTTDSELHEELRELLHETETPEKRPKDVVREIETLLSELGIPCHVKGYNALVEAIRYVIENPRHDGMTKEVYPAIAMKFNTIPSRIERTIRHAIELSFSRADVEILACFFGRTVDYRKDKPTNSEFIYRLAREIRYKMEA